MNSARKMAILLVIAALLSLVPALNTAQVGATHVEPTFVPDNPSCSALAPGTTELKVEPVADGVYSDGTLTVTIDVRDTANGQVFDWTSNIGVDAVFAKGGNDGNLYVHNPEETADTGLHAPVNPSNNQYFGLSHLLFCYDVEPPTNTPTNTPTDTPTGTPTDTPTPTNTPTDTPTPTNTPTDTPTPTNTPTDTPTPTSTPTNTPTFTPTPIRFEGCTPGYWKQPQHFDSWTAPYDPTDLVKDVFNVSAFLTGGQLDLNGDGADDTLLAALEYQGGSGTRDAARILLRAAVAALLNAASPDVDYQLSVSQVISQVNAALASNNRNTMLNLAGQLDRFNNAGCPLN